MGHPAVCDIFCPWAAFARVVVVDVPHHVTQRGNARQEKWGMSRLSPNYPGKTAWSLLRSLEK